MDFVSTDEKESQKTAFTIFPNPASDFISIKITGASSDLINWRLYNQLGQIVKEKAIFSNDMVQINLADLPKGIYFYTFSNQGKVVKKGKLIIQ